MKNQYTGDVAQEKKSGETGEEKKNE